MAEKDRNKKMKEIMERLEQGVKENLYFGNVHGIFENHVAISQLQF